MQLVHLRSADNRRWSNIKCTWIVTSGQIQRLDPFSLLMSRVAAWACMQPVLGVLRMLR